MSELRVKRDPEGTRRRILEAATEQFTKLGLAGARVDAIATAAGTNERMLYYYFASKEGLYVAVFEAMYAQFAEREGSLDLSGLQPADAIRELAQSIWTHLRANSQWLSLVNNENLHEGRDLERSSRLRETISPVVDLLRAILERGTAAGQFRPGIDQRQCRFKPPTSGGSRIWAGSVQPRPNSLDAGSRSGGLADHFCTRLIST